MDSFNFYKKIHKLIYKNGCYIKYTQDELLSKTLRASFERNSINGINSGLPRIGDRPIITIYYDHIYDLNLYDKIAVYLSHEWGHFQSYLNGGMIWPLIEARAFCKSNCSLNCREMNLIFNEEMIAWNYADSLLRKYQFQNMELLSLLKRESLMSYVNEFKKISQEKIIFKNLSFYKI